MKLFNNFFLIREINHYFKIYKKYIEFDDNEDSFQESNSIFDIIHVGSLLTLEERSYTETERFELLRRNLESSLQNISEIKIFGDILIMPIIPKFKLLPRKKVNRDDMRLFLSEIIKYKNSYGIRFIKEEITKKMLQQFCIIPFLFSYMDICIFDYNNTNHFYFVNHHTDIFEVKLNDKVCV